MRGFWILLVAAGLSGCLDSDNDPNDPNAVDDAVAPVTAATQALDWHGHIGSMATVCPAGVTCLGQGAALNGEWDSSMRLSGLSAVDLQMHWADDLANGDLAFGLAVACDSGCDFVDYASGPGPLSLNLTGLNPDHEYILVAWHPGGQEGMVYYQYGMDRDFHVAGSLLMASASDA